MAGAGYKSWVDGDILTAADVNTYLMQQAVMRFADASARSTAITSPSEGMVTYLVDTDAIQYYDGAAWQPILDQDVIEAKGDLIVGTADDTVARLAVGTNGQFLIADSGETTGLKWADAGKWTTYTPTWTASGGTPTIGNGTLTGKYVVINNWCSGQIRLVMGSTTSLGTTSEWRFSYPVTPVNINQFDTIGAALCVDVGTAGYRSIAFHETNIAVYGSDAAGTAGYQIPFTWTPANGDILTIEFSYEVA